MCQSYASQFARCRSNRSSRILSYCDGHGFLLLRGARKAALTTLKTSPLEIFFMVVQHRISKDSLPMCVENTQFVARAQLQERRNSPLHGLKSAPLACGLACLLLRVTLQFVSRATKFIIRCVFSRRGNRTCTLI